jgi:hypothetical protein
MALTISSRSRSFPSAPWLLLSWHAIEHACEMAWVGGLGPMKRQAEALLDEWARLLDRPGTSLGEWMHVSYMLGLPEPSSAWAWCLGEPKWPWRGPSTWLWPADSYQRPVVVCRTLTLCDHKRTVEKVPEAGRCVMCNGTGQVAQVTIEHTLSWTVCEHCFGTQKGPHLQTCDHPDECSGFRWHQHRHELEPRDVRRSRTRTGVQLSCPNGSFRWLHCVEPIRDVSLYISCEGLPQTG